MSTNKSDANSSSHQKWGRGSISSSARRMSKHNNSSNNLVPNNNNHDDNEGDTENIFDSIGRELDQCTADQNTNKDMANRDDNMNTNDDDIDMFAEIGKELAEHTNTNNDNEVLEIPRPLEEDNNKMDIEKLSIHSGVNNDQPTSNVDLEIPRELDIPVVPVANNNNNNLSSTGIPQQIQLVDATQNINTLTGTTSTQQQQSNKKLKRGANSTVKKLSPPRHSFQSSTMKQKSTIKKKSTFKTPAGSKFPSRDLFSTNKMPQRSTTKKSVANGTNVSTTQRKKRHSFRPSIATTSNTPAAPKSNVKEMRFAPTFLTNNSKSSPPKETVPIDDDNNYGDDTNKYSDKDVFAQNMVSTHHQAKQQARKSESSKSGYLVQRLRSLRNTEQRMAMKLRNSQLSSGLSGGGGGGGIRKRRRTSGGNNNLDPKTCSSSILDVTVSGKLPSDVGASLLGEGKSVLLAYIHQHTMTKQTSNEGDEGEEGSRGVSSCYAWIVMSHDVMREQGLLDGSMNTKHLRLYDAVVIPSRVVDMKTGSMTSGDINQTQCDMHRPTIVCTHISQAYPADQPSLQDVSFDQFSS